MEHAMTAAAALQTVPSRTVTFLQSRPKAEVTRCPTLCSNCSMRGICVPTGMQAEDVPQVDALVYTRRRIKRGEHVYRAGDAFHALYAFRSGFFKGYMVTRDGKTQVTGFPMAGDLIGMDGIGTDKHTLSVVALEDGEVCVVPYTHLQSLTSRVPALQHQFHRMMSREIVRELDLMSLLGSMRAEARVAEFLLSLSRRFAERGYSSHEFNLRMTREEIGSYLGLKLETVSRVLSKMQEQGLIRANLRYIEIVDAEALRGVTAEAA
jgi:CRP/FNR family transcriptional regulator